MIAVHAKVIQDVHVMHLHMLVSVPLTFIGDCLGHKHVYVEAGCSKPNGALYRGTNPIPRSCPHAACNWLLHPASASAQDGLDPVQLALVPIAQILHLQHALVVCFYQLVRLLMCKCIY